MKPRDATTDRTLELRWERIGLGVRCAYNPQRPDVVLQYLQAGRRLSKLQPQQEARIQRRMLELLLHTAVDEALPWPWRAVCLEHTAWPLARLTSLLGTSVATGGHGLDQRVQDARDRLDLPPRTDASASGQGGPQRHADR